MRLREPKLWLASVSLVLVTFLVVVDLGKTSPGPLSIVHPEVFIEKLNRAATVGGVLKRLRRSLRGTLSG